MRFHIKFLQLNVSVFWWAVVPFLPSNHEQKNIPEPFLMNVQSPLSVNALLLCVCMNGGCMCWSEAT